MDSDLKSIGILYVAIGKYTVFFDKFYETCEKNLFPCVDKTYYVFTDSNRLQISEEFDNIKTIKVENQGWPGNTLFRYHMFLDNKDVIKDNDFLLFLNANTVITKKVDIAELLPRGGKKLVVARHPYYLNETELFKLPFEKRIESTACVSDMSRQYIYCGGGFIGGYTEDFLSLTNDIVDNINKDLENEIVAQWHDEAHFNKYINENLDKTLVKGITYFYPLEFKNKNSTIPEDIKKLDPQIVILPKENFGGHNYLRGVNNNDKFSISFNENLVQRVIKVKKNGNITMRFKIYNDDVFNSFDFEHGRIVEEDENSFSVIWHNRGIQKYKKEGDYYV